MMKPFQDLTDVQWAQIADLLPELNRQGSKHDETRGRPLRCTRSVFNGSMWVIFSGASWSSLPRRYPSYQTCHRRFKSWCDEGILIAVAKRLFGPSADKFMALVRSRMRTAIVQTSKTKSVGKTSKSKTATKPSRKTSAVKSVKNTKKSASKAVSKKHEVVSKSQPAKKAVSKTKKLVFANNMSSFLH